MSSDDLQQSAEFRSDKPAARRRYRSRIGENPPYGILGGRWKRRHHSKPAPRHRPTRPEADQPSPVTR